MKENFKNELFDVIQQYTSFEENEGVKIVIEYYSKEMGNSMDRFFIKDSGALVNDRNISGEFNWNFGLKLDEFFQKTSIENNRWNKAEFTVYKDGRYDVKTWWDAEFQKSLYGTED